MDTSIALVTQTGQPALRLRTLERDVKKEYYKSTTFSPPYGEQNELREITVPFPSDGRSHRVALVWDMGLFRLHLDGKPEGVLAELAAFRWRDDSVLEPGLVLGGSADESESLARIDNVMLYDWAFNDKHAVGRTATAGFEPLARPIKLKPSVWIFGKEPHKSERLAVNFSTYAGSAQITDMKASLFEQTENGLHKLASGFEKPYRGMSLVWLAQQTGKEITKKKKKTNDVPDVTGVEALSASKTQSDDGMGMMFGLEKEEADKEDKPEKKILVLKIQGFNADGKPVVSREIKFDPETDAGDKVRYW
jgi:hypothetical protein